MNAATLTLDRADVVDIIRRLKALDIAVQKKVARAAVKGVAKLVGVAAKPAAPVRSGKLKKSLFIKVKTRGTLSESRAAFGRGAPYANFLEYGSRAYRHSGKYGQQRGQGGRIHNRRRSPYRALWRNWWRAHLSANEKIFISEVDLQMDKVLRSIAKKGR